MTLLVSEINPVNLPIFWLLSFRMRILVYRIDSHCPGVFARRFQQIDVSTYLTWANAHCFRSWVVDRWEEMQPLLSRDGWKLKLANVEVDLAVKARQELSHHFERLLLLQKIAAYHSGDSRVFIIESISFRHLRRVGRAEGILKYSYLRTVSTLNILAESFFLYLILARDCTSLTFLLAKSLVSKPGSKEPLGKNLHLWDSATPNEHHSDKDRRNFAWIVDGQNVSREDVLFILPPSAAEDARSDLRAMGVRAATLPEIYRSVAASVLMGTLVTLVWLTVKRMLLPMPGNLKQIQMANYGVSLSKMRPVIQQVEPVSYVSSISRIGHEDPSIAYLKATGAATVIYCDSAMGYMFGDATCTCRFRDISYAEILVSQVYVWNQIYAEWMNEHPIENVEVVNLGPLMPGDGDAFQSSPPSLRQQLIPDYDPKRNYSYITVFDETQPAGPIRLKGARYPNQYSDEYQTEFLRDMVRLLDDFEDLFLLYKPKRSLSSPRFSYSPEFRELVEVLASHNRAVVIDDAINPWIPIAAADICVGIPFTSPVFAGMHHGKYGLFHDPNGKAVSHKHQSSRPFMTTGYDQLRSRLESVLFSDDNGSDPTPPSYGRNQPTLSETSPGSALATGSAR